MKELFPKEQTARRLEGKPLYEQKHKVRSFMRKNCACNKCGSYNVLVVQNPQDWYLELCLGCELQKHQGSFILDGYVIWINQLGQVEFARL